MEKKSNLILIISIVTGILLALLVGILVFFNLPAQRIRRMLKTANKYIAEENYDEAILTLQKMLEIDPKNPVIYSNLAEVYFHKADNSSSEEEKLSLYESANENYLNVLNYSEDEDSALNDSLNELYLNWSQVYIEREDYITAQKVLKQGIDISEQEVLKDKLEEVAKQTSGSDMFNENARAVIISILQVYQPKSCDKIIFKGEGSIPESIHLDYNYTYDESGKYPITISYTTSYNVGYRYEKAIYTYRYDANMLPVSWAFNYEGFDDDRREVITDETDDFYYNDNGQLVQSVYQDLLASDNPENTSYEYDENGICFKYIHENQSFEFEHDDKGRIVTKISQNRKGTLTYNYEYDELNRIIKKTVTHNYDNRQLVVTYNY